MLYEIIQRDFTNIYEETYHILLDIYQYLNAKYADKRIGIFLSNDNHALIFTNILSREKRTIPDEFEIIGFDNTVSNDAFPPITTVSQDIKKIARTTIELLTKQISQKNKNQELAVQKVLIDPQLILRDTTQK